MSKSIHPITAGRPFGEKCMLTFELPWPPSVNHYYHRLGRRVFLSHKGRLFRSRVQEILQAQEVTPLEGPLDVVVDLYPPDRRRRDCDNPIKALCDALQHGGAYGDDSQIVKLTIAMHQPAPGGRTVVHIRNCQDEGNNCMNCAKPIIDDEFQALIPPATAQELDRLEDNIVADGCRDALVTWQGWLLDGHNRLRICREHDLPFQTVAIDLPDREAAKAWIINNQFGRRNLSPYTRAELALKLEEIIKAKAKRRQLAGLKKGQSSVVQNSAQRKNIEDLQNPETEKARESVEIPHESEPGSRSREAAAASVGLSHDTIDKARVIAEKAPEPMKEALRKGETTIHAEYRKLKRQEEKDRRQEELSQLAATLPPASERWQVICDDFVEACKKFEDASIDIIVTDPPYSQEYLPLYGLLGQTAARLLKPGGSLLVMTGKSYLPEVLAALTPHLKFHWLLAYLTPGGQAPQIWDRRVNTFWKPFLWLVRGNYDGPWIGDVIHSDANDNDKRFHEWGQSESGMTRLVERFTEPGHIVLDPFCGGGTTGVVALRLGCHFVGIDCDAKAVETARNRLIVASQETALTGDTYLK